MNRSNLLVKSPRIFRADTGLAQHLGATAPSAARLETMVLHHLLAAREEGVQLAYWRTSIGEEVDFGIDAGGKLLPIEVKATSMPRLADCSHLRTCRQECGRKAPAGILLQTGRPIRVADPRRAGGAMAESALKRAFISVAQPFTGCSLMPRLRLLAASGTGALSRMRKARG